MRQALWKRRRTFESEGGTHTVAPLADLIRSKRESDRPKDRLFLETYRATLEELLGRERGPS